MANRQSSYFFLGIPFCPLQKQTVPIPVLSGAHDHFQTSSKEIRGEKITLTLCSRLHTVEEATFRLTALFLDQDMAR